MDPLLKTKIRSKEVKTGSIHGKLTNSIDRRTWFSFCQFRMRTKRTRTKATLEYSFYRIDTQDEPTIEKKKYYSQEVVIG